MKRHTMFLFTILFILIGIGQITHAQNFTYHGDPMEIDGSCQGRFRSTRTVWPLNEPNWDDIISDYSLQSNVDNNSPYYFINDSDRTLSCFELPSGHDYQQSCQGIGGVIFINDVFTLCSFGTNQYACCRLNPDKLSDVNPAEPQNFTYTNVTCGVTNPNVENFREKVEQAPLVQASLYGYITSGVNPSDIPGGICNNNTTCNDISCLFQSSDGQHDITKCCYYVTSTENIITQLGGNLQGCESEDSQETRNSCVVCMYKREGSEIRETGAIWTELGCIDPSPAGLVTRIFQIGIGILGGLGIIRVVQIALVYQTGDQEKIKEAREMIMSLIAGMILLVSGVIILKFIGINVLGLPAGFLGGG